MASAAIDTERQRSIEEQFVDAAQQLGLKSADFESALKGFLKLEGALLEKVDSIEVIDAIDALPEQPPMVIIGRKVAIVTLRSQIQKTEKMEGAQQPEAQETEREKIAIGTLYNPGFTPDITACGLAIAQVAGTYVEGNPAMKGAGRPTMVASIKKCAILDQKTQQDQPLIVAVKLPSDIDQLKKNDITIQNGQVINLTKYGPQVIGNAQMTVKQLLLKMLKRGLGSRAPNQAEAAQSYLATLQGTPAANPKLPVSNFGPALVIENIQSLSDTLRVGSVNLGKFYQENPDTNPQTHPLFPGHFPDKDGISGEPIIPLAGITGPAFMMIHQWFQELTGLPPENFSIQNSGEIEIKNAVGPHDVLVIEAELLSSEENGSNVPEGKNTKTFKVTCSYFDKADKKQPAVTFEAIKIAESHRYDNMWANPAVADAFKLQSTLLEEAYHDDHVARFKEIVTQSIQDHLQDREDRNLTVLDLGTGEAAVIPRAIMDGMLESRSRINAISLNLILSDVTGLIVTNAEQTLREILSENSAIRFTPDSGEDEPSGVRSTRAIQITIQKAVAEETATPTLSKDQEPPQIITANFCLDYTDLEEELQRMHSLLADNGEIVIGLVKNPEQDGNKTGPAYHQLVLQAMENLKQSGYRNYHEAMIMQEVGTILARASILGNSNIVNYRSPKEAQALLEKHGFQVLEMDENTYAGLGFIVRAKKITNPARQDSVGETA